MRGRPFRTASRSGSAAGHREERSAARCTGGGWRCTRSRVQPPPPPPISSDPAPCRGHIVRAGPSIGSHYRQVNRPRSKRFSEAFGLHRIELSNETGGLEGGQGVKRKQKTGDSFPILLLGAAPYSIIAPISPFSPQSTCLCWKLLLSAGSQRSARYVPDLSLRAPLAFTPPDLRSPALHPGERTPTLRNSAGADHLGHRSPQRGPYPLTAAGVTAGALLGRGLLRGHPPPDSRAPGPAPAGIPRSPPAAPAEDRAVLWQSRIPTRAGGPAPRRARTCVPAGTAAVPPGRSGARLVRPRRSGCRHGSSEPLRSEPSPVAQPGRCSPHRLRPPSAAGPGWGGGSESRGSRRQPAPPRPAGTRKARNGRRRRRRRGGERRLPERYPSSYPRVDPPR